MCFQKVLTAGVEKSQAVGVERSMSYQGDFHRDA